MDPRGPPMYQHPRMSMMGQSHIGSVPGDFPINVPIGIPDQAVTGMQGVHMSSNHDTFSHHKPNPNKIPEQQQQQQQQQPQQQPQQQQQQQHHHYSQLPLRKEVDDEGRICGVVLPENPTPLPTEINNAELAEGLQEKVKTEDEEIDDFMEVAHDMFLKISSKEITIKAASEKLGQPYSFVYSRYQEFCDKVTGKVEPVKKKKAPTTKGKKGKKGKRRPKRLTMAKGKPRVSGKIYECEDCPAIFYREYQLRAHSKVHLEESESHKCTACGVIFPKLIKLMHHRIEVHEEAMQCPHCDSQFTVIASYRKHVRTHSASKPYVCHECGKGFCSSYILQCHKRVHTGERPFMCGICEKTFITLPNLKTHQYVHTGGPKKPFECELCGQRFQYNSGLVNHMNVHTGAKPFSCDMCDKRFNLKQNLDRHRMTHTGKLPYKCDLCPASFYVPTHLKSHQIAHTGLKPFKCDLCDYACTRKSNLEYHKNTHTGETPFKCDFYGCNAEYARPNSLKHHKLQHGPPPPQTCNVCNEKLPDLVSLKRHMMTHTGEKPHTCDQCFKTCVDKAALKRHMYKHMYRPLAQKTKQVRQSKKNPVVKKPPKPVVTAHKKMPTEYQPPQIPVAENGHQSIAHTWNINAEDTNSQPPFHPFTATQYTNLVNNAWPSTMDPDELRRRLLNSFK